MKLYRVPEKMRGVFFRVPLTYLNRLQTKWIMTLFLPDLKAPLTGDGEQIFL